MGWSQSYKQGSEEGRGELARAGRQRPRWRGREGLESGVSWPRRPLLLFSEGACPAPFPLCPRGVFLYQGVLLSPLAYPKALPAPSDGTRTLHLGSWGPIRLSPKSEIPKEAWSLGAKNSVPPPYTPVPYLTPLSPPPTAICLYVRGAPGPCANGHCIARAEGGKATRALRETGPGANKLSLPQS